MITALITLGALAMTALGATIVSSAHGRTESTLGLGIALAGICGTAAGFIAVFNGGF